MFSYLLHLFDVNTMIKKKSVIAATLIGVLLVSIILLSAKADVFVVISGFTVVSGGQNYTTPHVMITGGGGSGATAVARVSCGVIYQVILLNKGEGYTSAPTVILRDPSPRAREAVVVCNLEQLGITTNPTAIDWGQMNPGATLIRTMNITNIGNTNATLSMAIHNMPSYLSLTWDSENIIICPNAPITSTLTLIVSPDAPPGQQWDFNIVIAAW